MGWDPAVLFFVFGLLAGLARSELMNLTTRTLFAMICHLSEVRVLREEKF